MESNRRNDKSCCSRRDFMSKKLMDEKNLLNKCVTEAGADNDSCYLLFCYVAN